MAIKSNEKIQPNMREQTKISKTEEVSYPKKVEDDFMRPSFWGKLKYVMGKERLLKTPILQLMTSDEEVELFEGVEPGIFDIDTGKEKKRIYLPPGKMKLINLGVSKYPGWVANENEATPYPHDVNHDSRTLRILMDKQRMNYEGLESAKIIDAKTKRILYIGGGIALAIYFFFTTPYGAQVMEAITSTAQNTVPQVAEKAVETAQNIKVIN